MSGNDNYNIEDFWPGAEELLDQHFKKKPGFGTKGIIALALLIVGGAIGGYMLYSDASKTAPVAIQHELNSPSNTAESAPSANTENESNSTFTSESSANVSSNETSASTSIAEKTSATPTHSNEATVSNLASHSNAASPKKTTATTNATVVTSNNSKTNAAASTNQATSTVEVYRNQSTAGLANANTANGSVNNTNVQSDRVTTTSGSVSTSTANASNVEVTPSTEITASTAKERAALNSTANAIATSTVSSATQTKNPAGNTLINPSNSKGTKTLSTEGITSLMRLPLGSLETPLALASIANDPAQSELLKSFPIRKKPFAISYQLGAGVFAISKQLSASNADDYVQRRLAEEKNATGTSFQAGVRIQHNRWAMNSGVEFNQYGENIQYDSWLLGSTNAVNPVTTYQLDSMVNVRYFYYQGNEFINTTITQFTDTILTFDTTQVTGKVAADVSKINSRTMISYVEIPLAIDYDFIQKKHFSFALRTGVSMGILSQRRGYYLDRQLAEFTDISASKEFRTIMWNARVGVDAQYFFRPAFSVFIRPEFRTNLQSVFNSNTGINQRYAAWGVSIGLSKSF